MLSPLKKLLIIGDKTKIEDKIKSRVGLSTRLFQYSILQNIGSIVTL
ncbi:MAG: hypothetical protein ACI8X3_001471, partial [Saprospiraceae bacterium]